MRERKMNSEKVKEINKKLQQINERELSSLGMILQFEIDVNDILTYINELESENKRLKIQLAQANAGIVNCSGCKLVELNAVKEFAERLKDKVKNFCGTEEENHYYDVSKEGACEEIDETLKEFIND